MTQELKSSLKDSIIINGTFLLMLWFWNPILVELDNVNKVFSWSAVLVIIILFMELPVVILRASQLHQDPKFDNVLFKTGISINYIVWFFLFRLAFSETLCAVSLNHILAGKWAGQGSLFATIAILLLVKEIASFYFALNPQEDLPNTRTVVIFCEGFLLFFSALFFSILQVMFSSESTSNKIGTSVSLENLPAILFMLCIMGLLIMSTYYGSRILLFLQEKNQWQKKNSPKWVSWLNFFVIFAIVIYPVLHF